MGWVKLTVRSRELRQQQSMLQLRDMQISRTKRQLSRRKQYEKTVIQNGQKAEISPLKHSYEDYKESLEQRQKDINSLLGIVNSIATGGSDGMTKLNDYSFTYTVGQGNGEYVVSKDGKPIEYTTIVDASGNIVSLDCVKNLLDKKDLKNKINWSNENDAAYKAILAEGWKVETRQLKTSELVNGHDQKLGTKDGQYKVSVLAIHKSKNYYGYQNMGDYGLDNTKDMDKFKSNNTRNILEFPEIAKKLGITYDSISSPEKASNVASRLKNEYDSITSEINKALQDYTEDTNYVKEDYDMQLQMLEEETADEELNLELEQSELETELEAISQEFQSLSQSVSSDIQQNTIRLA